VRVVPDRFLEREFQPNDLEALLAIEAQAGSPAWTRPVFKRFLAHKSTRARVVSAGATPETPIAFYVVQVENDEVYLANLAVARSWRRQAVATFALENLTSWSRQRGLSRISLHVQEDNLGAQLLYKENGFRAVRIIHEHFGRQDGYFMRKDL
jgi:ribosomal-protein-alanine N-acetyltransferase